MVDDTVTPVSAYVAERLAFAQKVKASALSNQERGLPPGRGLDSFADEQELHAFLDRDNLEQVG